ncbi:hypothetical protein ACFE04_030070 [Oxalis oulophora]
MADSLIHLSFQLVVLIELQVGDGDCDSYCYVVDGVPMVAWPLYAEQHLNRNLLGEEMKMADGVEQRDEDGFVTREEVEKRVREVMTSTKLNEKSNVMRDLAMAAFGEFGSSTIALARFVRSWSK